jgi:hypothetical protein
MGKGMMIGCTNKINGKITWVKGGGKNNDWLQGSISVSRLDQLWAPSSLIPSAITGCFPKHIKVKAQITTLFFTNHEALSPFPVYLHGTILN